MPTRRLLSIADDDDVDDDDDDVVLDDPSYDDNRPASSEFRLFGADEPEPKHPADGSDVGYGIKRRLPLKAMLPLKPRLFTRIEASHSN